MYALLTALAGSVSGFQPIAFVYIFLPIAAGVLLRKEKWWGCLFGVAMGGILIYNGMTAQPRLMAAFAAGMILVGYYGVMGLLCAAAGKNK